ncbi:unnamed protein product [Boreogadus saida]
MRSTLLYLCDGLRWYAPSVELLWEGYWYAPSVRSTSIYRCCEVATWYAPSVRSTSVRGYLIYLCEESLCSCSSSEERWVCAPAPPPLRSAGFVLLLHLL